MIFRDLGLLVLLLVRAVAEVPDPEKDLVLIGRAQSVVVGNYFYTVGGYAAFIVPDGFPFGGMSEGLTKVTASNGHLRRIDLTRPFTVTKIDTVQEENIPLSDLVPRMHSGTIWAINTTIYLGPSDSEVFPLLENGTWRDPLIAPSFIWTYDTSKPDLRWNTLPLVAATEGAVSIITGGSVAYLNGIAYIMGGKYNIGINRKYPNGTLRAKASESDEEVKEVKLDSLFKLDIEKKIARNETGPFGDVNSGRMVSIESVGEKGILVYIGGLGIDGFNLMSTVRVYDIASSTWKTQKAVSRNGDPPRARRDFCAVVMSAQDHSSHQIYFYGGYPYGPPTISPLDDLWVLTLPSFQFIKVSNSLEARRASGTCGVISPQYLLAYRGESFEGSDRINALLNASLALLDLTDLEWKTEYTPANISTVYKVPRKVIEIIGGDKTGNATATALIGGFDDKSLAAVFKFSDSRKPTSFSSASPPPSSSVGTDPKPKSPYTTPPKNGVVIGVPIACVAVALLSTAGIALLFRRRRRNKLQALAEELGPRPWERREVDGNMLAPAKHELEGSRPVVHEMDGGWEGAGEEEEEGGEREGEEGRKDAIHEPETRRLSQSHR